MDCRGRGGVSDVQQALQQIGETKFACRKATAHVDAHAYAHAHTRTQIHPCTRTCARAHTRVHTRPHTHKHAYVHTYTHADTRILMATRTYPARIISDESNQLDDCGRSSAMSILLQHGYIHGLLSSRAYVDTHTHSLSPTHMYTHTRPHAQTPHTYKQVRSHIYTCIHVHRFIYLYMPARARARAPAHTHTHTHTHVRMHIHLHAHLHIVPLVQAHVRVHHARTHTDGLIRKPFTLCIS